MLFEDITAVLQRGWVGHVGEPEKNAQRVGIKRFDV